MHRQLFYLTAAGRYPGRGALSEQEGIRTYVYPYGPELVGCSVQFGAGAAIKLGSLGQPDAALSEDLAPWARRFLTF